MDIPIPQHDDRPKQDRDRVSYEDVIRTLYEIESIHRSQLLIARRTYRIQIFALLVFTSVVISLPFWMK